ncbi:hypothetical protein RvY_04599-2 [Ramazzottius varieornatus]|uniref:ubiquitinyl hydrolase 1 n=1 Tax=Ramazzottius varieornatus TaxID=947166 RepID=A0A1D1US41_RAMVA|nr:hypothetical protein RvY_04599-2 [Ramazzottius varieornatus]
MPDTVNRRLTVGQPPQHSPPTTSDGVPAGKKSRTTSPLPMDQENTTKLPMPLLLENGGKGDGGFVEDMDIEDDAQTMLAFSEATKLEPFDQSPFHTPPSSPHRTPHETSSEGLFDELSPVRDQDRDDRSSSVECEADFSLINREDRESSFEAVSPGSSSDAEKTIRGQPSSSSDSENGFVMVENYDAETAPLLPKTVVSNDTLANLTNLSVNSPVPLVMAESEPLPKEQSLQPDGADSQDVILHMGAITLKSANYETKVALNYTLPNVTWMEFSCTSRIPCLRFKSKAPGYYEQFAMEKNVKVDENTVFRFEPNELWGEVQPVEPSPVASTDESTFSILLTKAAHCQGQWPHLFVSGGLGAVIEAVSDYGVFPQTAGDIPVRAGSLVYDWNEDPRDKLQNVYVNFRFREATLVDLQCTQQRFLLRFKTSDHKFLLQNASIGPSGWVQRTSEDIFRYESEPLFAPIESIAHGEGEEACKSMADQYLQILLVKKTRAYWHDLFLKSPTEPVKRNTHLEEPKSSVQYRVPPRATYRTQDHAVSSTSGYLSGDDEEDGENINTMFRQNGESQGWHEKQSRSVYGRQNGWNSGSNRMYRYESIGDLSDTTPYSPQVVVKKHYGLTGLNNLGNSCYLNAVVQCLANTRELRDYFIKGRFVKEVNKQNPLGSKGNFARVMQGTLKALWSGQYSNYSPYPLREVMAKSNEQFATKGQQDAQEAMACIIEALHEDLNRVTKKPYKEDIESDGKDDEEIANETWNYYLSREDSAIHDLFTGMFKSTVECMKCHKKNIKFDAYQCVSVPVPRHGIVIECRFYSIDLQKPVKKFRVTFNKDHKFCQDRKVLQPHLGDVPLENTEILILKRPSDSAVHDRIVMSKENDFPCSKLDENMRFLIFEVLTRENASDPVQNFVVTQFTRLPRDPSIHRPRCGGCSKGLESHHKKRCTKCYTVSYCGKECQIKHWPQHRGDCNYAHGPAVGLPFIVSLREKQLNKTNFFIKVAKSALKSVTVLRGTKAQSRPSSTTGSGDSPAPSEPSSFSSSAEPQSPPAVDSTVTERSEPTSPSPQRTGTPSDTFSDCDSGVGSSLSVNHEAELTEWNANETARKMMMDKGNTTGFPFALLPEPPTERPKAEKMPSWKDEMDNDEKAMENLMRKRLFHLVWDNIPTLPLRVEDKVLDADEDESCRSLKNERERRYGNSKDDFTLNDCVEMLTEPEVLDQSNAWMCPACKKPQEAVKKFEIWSLPTVLVFQLKRFSKPSGEMWRRDKIESSVEIPEELDMSKSIVGPGDGGPYIYDLYGVVNHRGSTWFGHYVAYTRCYQVPNTQDDEIPWRSFDDEYVQTETKLDGISSSAYLLFYRRRGTPNPIHLPASSGEEESSEGDSDDPTQGSYLCSQTISDQK